MLTAITFPSLGIEIDVSPIAFTIFGKAIYWYGIIIACGFALAVIYGLKRCSQFGLTQDNILDMLIITVPLAIIGARAYYCIFNWELYADNPISVLYIWNGGLAIYGAVIVAILTVLIFAKVKKLKATPIMDIGSLGLLIGQMIGRWGNFINGEAHGTETDSFLRMGLVDASGTVTYYHPTFLYESLWNLVGFILLHFLSKRRKYDGQIFLCYIAWYGLGRGFIEGMRTDSLYLAGTDLRVSQLLAFASCLAAVAVLAYNALAKEHDERDLYVNVVAARAAAEAEMQVPDTSEKTVSEEPFSAAESGADTPDVNEISEPVDPEKPECSEQQADTKPDTENIKNEQGDENRTCLQ